MKETITVSVKIYKPTATRIAGEVAAVSKKKVSITKVAQLFAQNLIDRYFDVEYLDAEAIADDEQ